MNIMNMSIWLKIIGYARSYVYGANKFEIIEKAKMSIFGADLGGKSPFCLFENGRDEVI